MKLRLTISLDSASRSVEIDVGNWYDGKSVEYMRDVPFVEDTFTDLILECVATKLEIIEG